MLCTSGCEKEAVGDIFNLGQKFEFAYPHVHVQKLVCSWGIVKCCDEERLVVVTIIVQVDSQFLFLNYQMHPQLYLFPS